VAKIRPVAAEGFVTRDLMDPTVLLKERAQEPSAGSVAIGGALRRVRDVVLASID
jgi:hypothetical protein